jgi:hypothetical protein
MDTSLGGAEWIIFLSGMRKKLLLKKNIGYETSSDILLERLAMKYTCSF